MWLILFSIVLVLAGAHRLTVRYVYGPRTSRALKLTAVAAFVLAYGLAVAVLPAVAGGLRLLLALALSLPLFITIALIVTEVAARTKYSDYDEALSTLTGREQACLDRIARLKQSLDNVARRRRDVAGSDRQSRGRNLVAVVERWQQEEGLARVRSLKVNEWRQELERLSRQALGHHRRQLETELAGDPAEQDAIRTQLALAELRQLALTGGDEAQPQQLERETGRLAAERSQLEQELIVIREDLQQWEGRKRDFLARDIPLD